MSERKMLSAILLDAGRITDDDIESALEHQRLHGGFFGEALVALGIVSRTEVDWALASQFELPYIFPDPDTADPDVAALVTPDWALANLAVPVMRAEDSLTVVVANPLQRDVVEELEETTGLKVALALAAPARIRALIRALYGQAGDPPTRRPQPQSLPGFIGQVLAVGADRFGISARGPEAWGWYAREPGSATGRRDTLCRVPLTPDWEAALAAVVHPLPVEENEPAARGQRVWAATLRHGGSAVAMVDAEALVGVGGVEYLFRLQGADRPHRAMEPGRLMLPSALIAELRLLARSDRAHIAVACDDPVLVRAVLGSLPPLILDEPVRAVHLTDRPGDGPEGVYVLEAAPGDEVLGTLDGYRFDAVTIDLPADEFPLERIVAAAPVAFAYLRESEWRRRLPEFGIEWVLELSLDDRGGMGRWELSSIDL